MRIELEREGGYANIHLTYQVEVEDLPKVKAEKLKELVKSSRVMEFQPSDLPPRGQVSDAFNYRLSISEGGKKQLLSFNDVNAPISLRPLLTFLEELAWEEREK